MRIGNLLVWAGLALVVIGVAVRLGLFGWFGKLPGDIRIEGERTSVFAPITSMLLLSIGASVLVNLILRLFRGE